MASCCSSSSLSALPASSASTRASAALSAAASRSLSCALGCTYDDSKWAAACSSSSWQLEREEKKKRIWLQ